MDRNMVPVSGPESGPDFGTVHLHYYSILNSEKTSGPDSGPEIGTGFRS